MVRASLGLVLRGWCYEGDELTDAQMVGTELATNAVQHGKCADFTLHVVLREGSAVIEIEDDNPQEPREPESIEEYAESGRGLMIVRALSEEWGVRHDHARGRKRVWARMPRPLEEA